MEFFARNWKFIAALAGIAITREMLQRRKMIDLRGKVVLITGSSRGLGLALAKEFAAEGAKLILCARDEDELNRARMGLAEQGADVLTLVCDVTDQTAAQRTIEQAIGHYGRLDVLVNNAGVISAGAWRTQTHADFEDAFNIMFWGPFHMTMAALPFMTERKSGRIVNITSVGGKVSVPHLLSYSSAKFAAVGFSEGLHAELAQEGIVVVTVAPGLMRTGSQVNTVIKGSDHQTEYTLFTLLDTLPVSSISVKRAARQIVRATRRGTTELIITLPAQLLARFHGALPGLSTEILGLVNRLLPTSDATGTERHAGRESETPLTRSFLTSLGRRAARDYNEQPGPSIQTESSQH